GECRGVLRALKADDDALEDLDALALGLLGLALDLLLDGGLLDPHVDADGVPGRETGEALLQVPRLHGVAGIHFLIPRLNGPAETAGARSSSISRRRARSSPVRGAFSNRSG